MTTTYECQLARRQHFVHVLLAISNDPKVLRGAHGNQVVYKRTELDLRTFKQQHIHTSSNTVNYMRQ